MSPIEVDKRHLNMHPCDKAATNVIAAKHRLAYSHGPNLRAKSAITGLRNVATRIDKKVPAKEAKIPIVRALVASPFFVMGYASKVVAIEAELPGIPINVAPIKEPDTPLIYMAISKTKAVTGSIPIVIGSKREIPIVALSPGMAPKIIPNTDVSKISTIYPGWRMSSKLDKYASIMYLLKIYLVVALH
jgi:hypothetical protein